MSLEVELAKIELRIAEDAEVVTAAEVMRWIRNRPNTDATIAWIERAVSAVGMSKRIKAGNPVR